MRHLIGDLILRYVSTRGDAPILGFSEVLLAGLARDGGLYVPETWPTLTPDEIACLDGYHERVRAQLLDKVLPETRDYLIEATAPLSY